MKKAKEYFLELKEVLDTKKQYEIDKKIIEIFNEFLITEMTELIETRKAKSDQAMMSIAAEQNRKWNSLCDKVETYGFNLLVRDGFSKCFKNLVLDRDKNKLRDKFNEKS